MMVFIKTDQELWRIFIGSVFYVGKGSRSRPFQHLYEAVKNYKNEPAKKKVSEKIRRIHQVWDGGWVQEFVARSHVKGPDFGTH